MGVVMNDLLEKPAETLRLHQANERTMLAWVRTGIALMAFGFAIARFGLFLRQIAAVGSLVLPPPHGLGSAWLGGALVAMGTTANLLATVRYGRTRHAIERGDVGAPSGTLVYVTGIIVALVGLAMTVLLASSLGD
jgi:putative membrane protein